MGRDRSVYPVAGEVLGVRVFLALISILVVIGRLWPNINAIVSARAGGRKKSYGKGTFEKACKSHL
jgi:hypothetical protein